MTPTTGSTPQLDEWVAEVGESQVLAAVTAAIGSIESGKTPGFTDRDDLLAYLGRCSAG